MMTRSTVPVITIDGPVGSGKGTVAGRLAARLGWHLLESGALYRLVALKALREGVEADDARGLEALARIIDSRLEFDGAAVRALLDDEDVTEALRAEAVSVMASKVAVQSPVRGALVERQRAFRQPPGLVADGRDMGTVLFPDAAVKVFLTASVQARAERRYKQLKAKGENVNLSRLFRDLEERDARDRNRAIAPLKPAPDSVVIDSTELGPDDVVDEIYSFAEKAGLTS